MTTHAVGDTYDRTKEWRSVALLSLGFGLVGLDRFMIIPMFPALAGELGLDLRDLGILTGALAITWGISSIFMGRIADTIGTRKVVVGALVVFSLLAGFHGLAGGLAGLVLVRALMGFFEGAYTPAAIVATLDASPMHRHGRNLGIQQAAMPLFGLAIAPILITQLLDVVDWRTIFVLLTLPGLMVAWLLWRTLPAQAVVAPNPHAVDRSGWRKVLRYRNIRLNVVAMMCWLIILVVFTAMMPSYLIDGLGLSTPQMGFVLSAIGFGATLGTVTMPTLSDRFGRKPVMVLGVACAIGLLIAFTLTGANPPVLFALLFGIHFFNFSNICLTVGPISAESVPEDLKSTASGLVVGIGEIFGGGCAPIIAGFVAHQFGIASMLYLALGGLVVGLLVAFALNETAPGRTRDDTRGHASGVVRTEAQVR